MEFKFLQTDSALFRFAEWVQRLVFANLLWIFFTLLGLIIFGIFPATKALFALVNKWVEGHENISTFRVFWLEYKSQFIKSNLIGLVLTILALILAFNLNYYRVQENIFAPFLFWLNILFAFLYILIFIYIFPLSVKYDLKFFYLFKNALFISFLSPGYTLLTIGCMLAVVFVFFFLPSLLPFISISALAYVLMWGTSKSFAKVEEKIRDHAEEKKENNDENNQENTPENEKIDD